MEQSLTGRLKLLQRRISEIEHRIGRQEAALAAVDGEVVRMQALLFRLHDGPRGGARAAGGSGSPFRLDNTRERPDTLTPAELVSSVAHELSQPLTAIATYGRACLRMLENGVMDQAELIGALEQIAVQAEHAGRFLNHVRDQLASGTALRIPVQINAQIGDVARRLGPRFRQEQTRLEVQLANDLPEVSADPVQVEQVLLNLINNALEAMRQIPAEERVLTVRSTREEEEITVHVTDTGPGVSPEVAARLFEPLPSNKPRGMGLGLALCRSIIGAHCGHLGMKPGPGRGVTFFFSLPTRASA